MRFLTYRYFTSSGKFSYIELTESNTLCISFSECVIDDFFIMNEDYEAQGVLYDIDKDFINMFYSPQEKLIYDYFEINPQIYRSLREIDFDKQKKKIFSDYINIKFFPDAPREVKERFFKISKSAGLWVKDQTEEMNMEAMKHNGGAIYYVQNPSEAVKMAAVENSALWSFERIQNPSAAMEIEAIKQTGLSIRFIRNPSEAMKLAAVQKSGYAIEFIENPSEALKMAAVEQDGCAIQFIENPSEAMKMAAVKEDGYALRYIENPSEAVKMAARAQILSRN